MKPGRTERTVRKQLEKEIPRQDLRTQETVRRIPIVAITDCKSLYDIIHRDGSFKAPSEKRLVMDLAAIREMLGEECPLPKRPGSSVGCLEQQRELLFRTSVNVQ